MPPVRVAFVVQRYGEVVGGAELLCRSIAERLAARAEVTVFTTCARDAVSWDNALAPGETHENGVRVVRFPTVIGRVGLGMRLTHPLRGRALVGPLAEQLHARCRGPYAPGLPRRLRAERQRHDLFVFFTYDYYPTLVGIHEVAERSVVVPTAHDDHDFHRPIVGRMLGAARRIIALTEEEEALIRRRMAPRRLDVRVAACGIEAPDVTRLGRPAEAPAAPYILTLGRRKPGTERVPELARAFRELHGGERFVDDHGRAFFGRDLTWLLAGDENHAATPSVAVCGPVSDEARWGLMAGALALVNPSRFESLSLTLLESWSLGRPTLACAASDVMAGQSRRSGGGLTYEHPREFAGALADLLRSPPRRRALGQSGRAFCEARYRWEPVLATYLDTADEVGGRAALRS